MEDEIIVLGEKVQDNIMKLAYELFGEMREPTLKEQKQMSDYLDKISEPTGINFNDF